MENSKLKNIPDEIYLVLPDDLDEDITDFKQIEGENIYWSNSPACKNDLHYRLLSPSDDTSFEAFLKGVEVYDWSLWGNPLYDKEQMKAAYEAGKKAK